MTNVRFALGSAYALPAADGSYGVVFANALLLWLREPDRALREFRRVLRPGGLVAVRDPDYRTIIREPQTPLLEELRALNLRYMAQVGSPAYAPRQRQLLLQADFARPEGHADVVAAGTPEATRRAGDNLADFYAA